MLKIMQSVGDETSVKAFPIRGLYTTTLWSLESVV